MYSSTDLVVSYFVEVMYIKWRVPAKKIFVKDQQIFVIFGIV